MLRKLWEEKIRKKHFGFLVAGLVYGGAVCLLCQLLIRNGDMLLPLFGLDSKTADHIGQVLGQLRHSTIRSPWLLAAAICGVLGYLVSRIVSRKGRIVTAVQVKDGAYGLANVAPTVVKMMGLTAPECWEESMV